MLLQHQELLQLHQLLVASTGVAGTGNVTTSGLNTNGATLLIVTASVYGTSASTVSITDSGGNTWHALTNRAAPQNVQTAIWYAYDKSGSSLVTSANHTVTITSSGTFYPAINFSAWSGILTGSDPLMYKMVIALTGVVFLPIIYLFSK